MPLIKFNEKTPAEKLEEAWRHSDAPIIFQCPRTGKCYETWEDYLWGNLRANDKAATRDKRLKA